jgi:hypothetical protein
MAMVEESLYPIAIFIDKLKNDNIQLQLNSIRRLYAIARALGEERTHNELISFVFCFVECDPRVKTGSQACRESGNG